MKKISLLLALMIIYISLCACTSGDPNLPKYDELCKIKEGMLKEEVFNCYGDPQRTITREHALHPSMSNTFPILYYVYDSSDGMSIAVAFGKKEGETEFYVTDIITVSPEDT